jgi:hypothetical protein
MSVGVPVLPGRARVVLDAPALIAGVGIALVAVLGGPPFLGYLALGLLVTAIFLWPVLGVAALLILAPTFLLFAAFIPQGMPISFLLLVLTAVGLALRRVTTARRAPIRWQPVDKAAAFLLLNGLAYLPLSANWKTAVYGYHELFRLFLIYFVIRLLLPSPRESRLLLWSLAITAFGVLAYGVLQHFWGYEYVMLNYGLVESLRDYAGFSKAGVKRAYSITTSPITLGYMGMVAGLGALAVLAVRTRREGVRLAAVPFLAAAVGASAFSYTRSSWLGLVAGLATMALLVVRGRGRAAIVIVPTLAALAIGLLVPDVGGRLGRYALTIFSSDPTETSFHYIALVHAATYFVQNPFGVGLGSASGAGLRHGGGIEIWSENTFFLVGIQTGAQGLLALLVFLGCAAIAGYRLFRNTGASLGERRLGVFALLGVVGFSVGGMSLPALLDVSSFGPLWVALALVANAAEAGQRGGGRGAPLPVNAPAGPAPAPSRSAAHIA